MAQDIVFDSSGPDGQHGRDGHDGRNGSHRGDDGDRGGDATHPSPGIPGGVNFVSLASGASRDDLAPDQIEISGSFDPAQHPRQDIHQTLRARELGSVHVLATGGHGGDGGDGGDGGHGARGRDGRDATKHRDGGDGGPGGDGGDGGRGTDGAPGGHGGESTLRLQEKDSYLLMAVAHCDYPDYATRGGKGGKPGQHGRGGKGGPGGSGGDSYSWTEHETEYYYDANGDRQSRTVAHHHRNSGGWRGPGGSSGWTPNTPLHPGPHGNPGQFRIELVDEQGQTQIFDRRFDLELVDFQLLEEQTDDLDGIYEFGEVVRVGGLRLRNSGGMATPPHQRIRVILSASQWVWPHKQDELFIERSLQPGEEITLDGELRFRIPDARIQSPGDPLVIVEPVRPTAHQLGPEIAGLPAEATPFQRHYKNANLIRRLTTQYPVQNHHGVTALRSLAAGERTHMTFDIANISQLPIGSQTERPRKIAVQLELLEGDIEADRIVYLDQDGEEIDLDDSMMEGFDGYWIEIPAIAPHSSAHVRGQFGFKRGTPPYIGVTLRYTLWLEDLHDAETWRVAQQRHINLRVEPAYRFDPEARVLLVTNNNTSQEAFIAWQTLLEETLGLPCNQWSISRYGHLDLRKDLPDGTDLYTQLEDRVVLLLNQSFNPRESDDADMPTDYLRGRDFRQGATSNNTHFAIIGSQDFSMVQLLEPTSELRAGGDDFHQLSRFLRKEEITGGPLMQEIFRDDITRIWDEVRLHDWTLPFFSLTENKIQQKAQKLAQKLHDLHPNRRYVLIQRPLDQPERDGNLFFFLPRYNLGHVEVRRTLNTETSSAVVLRASDEQMNTIQYIFSEQVRFTLLLALPFELKLDRLNWLLEQEPDTLENHRLLTARALVATMLVDLAEEQGALRAGDRSLDEDVIGEKLSNLLRLLEYPLHGQIEAGSNKWDLLIELCAGVLVLSQLHRSWWKFWSKDNTISAWTDARMKLLQSRLFDAYALDPNNEVAVSSGSVQQRIQARVQELEAQIRQFKAQRNLSSVGQAACLFFERPVGMADQVYRDIDGWLDPTQRVWSAIDLQRAQNNQAAREQKQTQLTQINEGVRAQLLVQDSKPQPAQAQAEVVLGLEELRQPTEEELEQARALQQEEIQGSTAPDELEEQDQGRATHTESATEVSAHQDSAQEQEVVEAVEVEASHRA